MIGAPQSTPNTSGLMKSISRSVVYAKKQAMIPLTWSLCKPVLTGSMRVCGREVAKNVRKGRAISQNWIIRKDNSKLMFAHLRRWFRNIWLASPTLPASSSIIYINLTSMDLKRKYAKMCKKYTNISKKCRHEIYMQNMQKSALPRPWHEIVQNSSRKSIKFFAKKAL